MSECFHEFMPVCVMIMDSTDDGYVRGLGSSEGLFGMFVSHVVYLMFGFRG